MNIGDYYEYVRHYCVGVVIIVALWIRDGLRKILKAVTGGIMGVLFPYSCVAFGGASQNLPVIKISLILLIRAAEVGLFWAC